jgi:hypothetical protein
MILAAEHIGIERTNWHKAQAVQAGAQSQP